MASPGIIVPAYFGPQYGGTNLSNWNQKLTNAAATLGLSLIVVANPYNGPGLEAPLEDDGGDELRKKLTPKDRPVRGTNRNGSGEYWQAYLDAIRGVRNTNGAKVIGYVRTDRTTISQAKARSDIDTWIDWYHQRPGAGIDGIFLDEVSTDPAHISYYRQLYDYVQAQLPNGIVVNNFGTAPDPAYFNIGNSILIIQEDTYARFEGGLQTSKPLDQWSCTQLARSGILIHTTAGNAGNGKPKWENVLNNTYSNYLRWYYCTNDPFVNTTTDNPWDTLPPYFDQMVGETARYGTFVRVTCRWAKFWNWLRRLLPFEVLR